MQIGQLKNLLTKVNMANIKTKRVTIITIAVSIFVCISWGTYYGSDSVSLSDPTKKCKKVYVYPWGGNLEHYAEWPKDFFEKTFKEFDVIPVSSLKNLKDFEYVITEEVPLDNQELAYLSNYPCNKVLLFIYETPIVCPRDHNPDYHIYYSKIFTWNDDFIDNKKYFKITAPWGAYWYDIPDLPKFEDRKLAVFVGNIKYFISHPLAQYFERARLIDFFEQNHINEFHFYGGVVQERAHYKNYKGTILGNWSKDGLIPKIQVIKNYKFDFCYENVTGVNGFFSERIFQSFSAGCIPIYLGINNIEKYIPRNCFIAKTDFKNYEDLYDFMKNMSKETYGQYRENMRRFLASQTAYHMSTPYYIKHTRDILGLDNEREL